MFTLAFWKGAGERAIKTAAEVLGSYFVVGLTPLLGFDWVTALSVTGGSVVASLLLSLSNPSFTAGTPKTEVVYVPDGL